MLYDPKWEVKADPFSLPSLIAWLEMRPKDDLYCYESTGRCLLAQYFKSCGYDNPCAGPDVIYYGPQLRKLIPTPPAFQEVSFGQPRTFGAALERARAIAR